VTDARTQVTRHPISNTPQYGVVPLSLDTAATGRFKRANRDTLEEMRKATATHGTRSSSGLPTATAN
jgi:hypothetical protein